MTPAQRLTVFCGSCDGTDAKFISEAKLFAKIMHQHQLTLVFGGASIGIMGVLADTLIALGGKTIGVIPQTLVDAEIAHRNLTELHVVNNMHSRKTMMSDLGDAFVLLPGGIGSLEEFFEVWTWAKIGLHGKPIAILNTANYYDDLLNFLERTVTCAFLARPQLDRIIVDSDPEKLISRIMQTPVKILNAFAK